tara:strand:- start:2291 stop:3118 length:828 start_codon:yes stop_codon:yes gene_type:complete
MIYLNKPITKIQEVRLVQAITDLNITVFVPAEEAYKFSLLQKKFNMDIKIGYFEGIKFSDICVIDHSTPKTKIFNIERTLIFPKSITNYLKNEWLQEKEIMFSFVGSINYKRKKRIEHWLTSNFNKKYTLSNESTLYKKTLRKLKYYLRLDYTSKKNYGDLLLWSSSKGRKFPIKAWDSDYFNILLNSKFVLCPSGDFIWTYRFFEAILCGSIPIIEEYCDAYSGFRFFYMDDDIKKIRWDEKDALFNYNLCRDRITISSARLKSELKVFLELDS